MKSPTSWCRWLIPCVVCALVVSVCALAVRAKSSQYPRQQGFSKHLAKATKMSNDRTQKSVAVQRQDGVMSTVREFPVLHHALPVEPVCLRREGFLIAFQFRPPPSSLHADCC